MLNTVVFQQSSGQKPIKKAEKVVAKGVGMVYNVWTAKRFAKKRCRVSERTFV
jgi:hypothetical protein